MTRQTIRAGLAIALVAVCLAVPGRVASASTAAAPGPTWITNGTVWSILPLGPTTYLGGDFTEVSPPTGNALALDATTGVGDPTFPTVSGPVRAVVARPGGGWFLAGTFTAIGGKARAGLATTTADRRRRRLESQAQGWQRHLDRPVARRIHPVRRGDVHGDRRPRPGPASRRSRPQT